MADIITGAIEKMSQRLSDWTFWWDIYQACYFNVVKSKKMVYQDSFILLVKP